MRIAVRYASGMRSHQQIVKDAGRDEEVASLVGDDVKFFNVRDWRLRDSIPAERWKRFVDLDLATYEELAAHAASVRAA